MKCLILYNAYNSHHSIIYQVVRFKEALINRNVEVDTSTMDIYPSIIDGSIINRLKDKYDFIIYLDKDKYISNMLEKAGLRLFNNSKAIEICDDKMLTHIELANHNIKMPKTMAGLLCYTNDSSLSIKSIETIEREFKYPFIVKECYGSLGKGVYLVNNRNELLDLTKKLINIPHLYQEYIEESYGTDIRVLVIGGKVTAWMQRKSTTDFRSNIECGGKGIKIDLPEEFRKVAEKSAEILNLDYCGVDLLIGKNNQPILCEVNSNAFFKKLEEVSEIDIAEHYIDYILKNINK